MKKFKAFIDRMLPSLLAWILLITIFAFSIGLCISAVRWLLSVVGVI